MGSFLRSILLSAFFSGLLARGEAPTPPPDPQLAPLPESVSYTKSFTYPPKPENPNATEEEKALQRFKSQFPEVAKLEVIKTGQIRKEIEHFTNGSSLERWKSGQITFLVNSASPGQIWVTGPGMTPGESAASTQNEADFSELTWVNQGSYRGEEAGQGVKYFVYKSGDRLAWLDQATRLPVLFQSSKMKVLYTYQPPPDQPLQLPEKYIQKMEAVKRAWAGRRN